MSESDIPSCSNPSSSAGVFPLHDLLGLEVLASAEGRSALRLQVDNRHLRDSGLVHGGVIATLLDAAVGVASRSLPHGGPELVTIQLNVNFIRAARAGETLEISGEVTHPGRRTVVARAEVRTAAGILVATGSGTLFRLDTLPPS